MHMEGQRDPAIHRYMSPFKAQSARKAYSGADDMLRMRPIAHADRMLYPMLAATSYNLRGGHVHCLCMLKCKARAALQVPFY